MATFDSDFQRGEEAAKRLAKRMEEKLKSAEAASAQAEQDKRFSRRLREQSRREVEAESKAPRDSVSKADESAVERRIAKQRELGQAAEAELVTQRRVSGELQTQEQATRRLLQQRNPGRALQTRGPASLAEEQLLLSAGGGGAGGREPPRYFRQPEPPELPRGKQPLLPSGRQPLQIAQFSEPHPERPGQVIAERELRVAEETTQARLRGSEATATAASASDRFTGAMGRETAIQAAANREFQRYGALSSEWIGATSRGATTIGELGRQTTATIGKFGGWLAAGALLFTAIDAVKEIGHGAIESTSGVEQMSRVIDNLNFDHAQKELRQLSEHFNLPVGEVAETAFGIGKAYHNEAEAFEATRSALYAVKVGELEAGTATQYLIAVINGFHLPASQMSSLFDELLVSQKRYAIDLPSLIQGVGKAAGSFKAAGGHVHGLIALITTLQHVSGQSGSTIATAILRSPHFIQSPKNEAILKAHGINPALNAKHTIEDVYSEAINTAQGKSGSVQKKIAEGLFGPQYASRIGIFLLQNKKLHQEVFGATSPKNAKGVAEEQLQIVLRKTTEQLSRIKTDLGDIGSSLAQAHAFDAIGGAVKGLDLLLRDTNQLLELFNALPHPMQQFVAYAIQARLALGALRKFNVGERFGEESPLGRAGRRVFNAPNRDARLYAEQLVTVQKGSREDLSRVNSRAVSAARATEVAREKSLAAAAEREALGREGHYNVGTGMKSERYVAAEQNAFAAERSYEASLARQVDLGNERIVILRDLASQEEAAAALKAEMTDANARQLASSRYETIQGGFNKGELTAKQMLTQLGVPGGAPVGAPGAGRAAASEAGGLSLGQRQVREAAAMAEAERAARVAGAEGAAVGTEGGKVNTLRSRLDSGFSKAKLGFVSTEETLSAARVGMTGIRTSMSEMYAALGGITGIGIGIALALPLVEGQIKEAAASIAGGGQDVNVAEHLFDPKNSQRARQLQSFYRNVSTKQLKALVEQGLGGATQEGAPDWYTFQRALDRRLEERYQHRQAAQGVAVKGLLPDQLAGRLQQFAGIDPNSRGYSAARKKLEQEIASGAQQNNPEKYKAVQKHFQEIIAKNINRQGKFFNFLEGYNRLSDKLLEAYEKNLQGLVGAGPAYASHRDVRALVRVTEVRGLRDLTSGKSALEAKGAQSLSELTGQLESYGADELKLSQTLARTDRGRAAAYRPYIASLSAGLDLIRHTRQQAQHQIRQEQHRLQGRLRTLRQEGKDTGVNLDLGFGGSLRLGGSAKDQAQYKALAKKAKELHTKGKQINSVLRQQEKQLRAVIQEQRDAATEEQIGVINELGELASARIGGRHPVGQARSGLNFAQRALNYARSHGAAQKVIRTAVIAVLQAREQLQEALKSEAEELSGAAESLALARANGDPILEAGAELDKAQADLAQAKTKADRLNAEAELIQAEHKYDEARADIALSRLAIQTARTEDPVKQAAIKIREAELKLRTAHGTAARNEARAAKIEAVRERRNAVAQQAIENVEYDTALGRITTDQEISAYERILHTMKLSRDTKRSLMEKIHSLQEEASGSLELTVGNIRLPTLYDIRRAIQGGVNGEGRGRGVYNDHSSHRYEFKIRATDPKGVAREIHNTLNQANRNSRRSAGHLP